MKKIFTFIMLLFFLACKTTSPSDEYKSKYPLLDGALYGNFALVKSLVEKQNYDINVKDNFRNTALHNAVLSRNMDLITYLVEKNVEIDAKNKNGETALNKAAGDGNLELVKYLIEEQKLDINAKVGDEDFKRNVLFYAVEGNNIDTIDYLLKGGAAFYYKDSYGHSFVWFAISKGYYGLVKLLNIKSGDKAKLENATLNNLIDTMEYPLHAAAQRGDVLALKELILNKKYNINDLNENNWTPLAAATYYGKLEVVKFLVENGADINIKNNNNQKAIDIAVVRGYNEIAKILGESKN